MGFTGGGKGAFRQWFINFNKGVNVVGFGGGDKWSLQGGETDSATNITFADGQIMFPFDLQYDLFHWHCGGNDLDDVTNVFLTIGVADTAMTITIPALTAGDFSEATPVTINSTALESVCWRIDATASTAGDMDRIQSFVLVSGFVLP